MVIQLATCSEKQAAFFHVATLTCLDHAAGGGGRALNFLQLSTAFEGDAQAAQSLELPSQACRRAGLVI